MADALLSARVGLGFWGLSALAVGHAAREVEDTLEERSVPLMGVLGAFVFGAQMVSFAIPGTGSSSHLVGGLLLAAMLGPWGGLLTMTCVLLVQSLLFADGGLLALGANIFNMGVGPCLLGTVLLEALGGRRREGRRFALAVLLTSLVCVELGALGVAAETVLSGRTGITFARFAEVMGLIHLPIGIAEGAITLVVLRFLLRLQPGPPLARSAARAGARSRLVCVATLAFAAVLLGTVAVWFASPKPDGLRWALARVGPGEAAAGGTVEAVAARIQRRLALFSGYTLPADRAARSGGGAGDGWPAVDRSRSAAGLAGGLLSLVLVVIATLGASALKRLGGRRGRGAT